MRYERKKEFLALLSIISVIITMLSTYYFTKGISVAFPYNMIIIAIMFSASAAVLSLFVTQRLSQKREQRQVFMIYAREDIEIARKLTDILYENEFLPWLDVNEIKPGQVWQKAAIRALEESAIALVLISPNLSKDGFVQEELRVALDTLQEREKDISPVIPVRIDEKSDVPERLAHIQWVNLFEDSGIDNLLEGLKRVAQNN